MHATEFFLICEPCKVTMTACTIVIGVNCIAFGQEIHIFMHRSAFLLKCNVFLADFATRKINDFN